MGETSQGNIRTVSHGSNKVETLSIIDVAQKFLRDWAVSLPATCNQMNGSSYEVRRSHNLPGPFNEL